MLEPSRTETLSDLKKNGYHLIAHCGRPGLVCGHSKELDTDALIARYGPDYVFIGETRIAKAIHCSACGYIGGSTTLHPNASPEHTAAVHNAYRVAKGV